MVQINEFHLINDICQQIVVLSTFCCLLVTLLPATRPNTTQVHPLLPTCSTNWPSWRLIFKRKLTSNLRDLLNPNHNIMRVWLSHHHALVDINNFQNANLLQSKRFSKNLLKDHKWFWWKNSRTTCKDITSLHRPQLVSRQGPIILLSIRLVVHHRKFCRKVKQFKEWETLTQPS